MNHAYKLKDAGILGELSPGDVITQICSCRKTRMRTCCWMSHRVVLRASLITCPRSPNHVPAPGDVLCRFQAAQPGWRPIHIGQFNGMRW